MPEAAGHPPTSEALAPRVVDQPIERAIAQPVRAPDGGPTLCGASREARACARPTGETDRVRARGRLVPRHSPHDCRATAVARSRREAIRSNPRLAAFGLPRRNALTEAVPSGARRFISSGNPRSSRSGGVVSTFSKSVRTSSPSDCGRRVIRSSVRSPTRACSTVSATRTRMRFCTGRGSRPFSSRRADSTRRACLASSRACSRRCANGSIDWGPRAKDFPEKVTAFREGMAAWTLPEALSRVRHAGAAHSVCGQRDELLRALSDRWPPARRPGDVPAPQARLAAHAEELEA